MKNIEIAIRNLKRNRINSAIIIISLSLGFTCLILITTFLSHELRTDNFHKDKDRIYSISHDDAFHKGNKSYFIENDATEYIKNNFAQVEDICIYGNSGILGITIDNKNIANDFDVIETNSNFFNFFSYPLLIGNPNSVLEGNTDIVISDKLAQKFFGKDFSVGKTIEIEKSSKKIPYSITGIFHKTDQNSQLNFDMVVKIQPGGYRGGYIKLAQSSSAAELQSQFAKYKSEIPITSGETPGQYYLQSLKETYFDSSRGSGGIQKSQSKTTIWVVASIGLLIMALALFNFLGIVNYNLLERARNYSIYQLNGANKIQLINTILTEVFMLLAASFLLGIVFMIWILPVFNLLINTSINPDYTFQLSNLGLLLSVLLIAFTIVSLFVVFKLNSITGYSALKGIKINRKFQLPALNVFQLATTILLTCASLIIIKQIQFINNQDIGVDKQVIDLSVPRDKGNKLGILKTKLLQLPSVKNASITTNSVLAPVGMLLDYDEDGEKHAFTSTIFTADEDYVETLGIKVIKGENFSSDPSMNRWKCLINESLAKQLNIENLINAKLPAYNMSIIGIVKDFNYSSLRSIVSPAFIEWDGVNRHLLERASHILIKTFDNGGEQSIKDIKQAWNEVLPDVPFGYETIEQQYLKLHADNNKTIQLVMLCCFISILLSMMGMFAIVLQNSKLRIKEIGIRKVNGAKISEVMVMLNRDFVKWVVIAFVVATPIAYYTMNKWLENFAYKTSLSWWIFALAGLLTLGIALLTISWRSWRAATRNPVEALRYE